MPRPPPQSDRLLSAQLREERKARQACVVLRYPSSDGCGAVADYGDSMQHPPRMIRQASRTRPSVGTGDTFAAGLSMDVSAGQECSHYRGEMQPAATGETSLPFSGIRRYFETAGTTHSAT